MTWPVSPCRSAFRDDRCLPASVLGPVECCAFALLILEGVVGQFKQISGKFGTAIAPPVLRPGKPRKRYSWLKAMTLCIAAKCQQDGEPHVVCCFDAQVGSDYESSESEYKWRQLAPQVAVMFSGTLTASKDLLKIYEQDLSGVELTIRNYKDVLWKPMEAFCDETRDKTYLEEIGVKFLFVIAIDKEFRLVSINEHGPRDHDYYAAIGTGDDSATAMLRLRRPSHRTDIYAALYFVYEAKRIGEVSPHVGKLTHLNRLWIGPNGIDGGVLTSTDVGELDEAFKHFGPQPFDWSWGLTSPLTKPDHQSTTDDPSHPQPSPESPGGSDES
jgi:hypothetical protein